METPYPFNMGSEFSDYLVGNAGVLIAPFYYLNAEKLGKKNLKYWGDKYPHFDEALPQMKKMFPRAKYIMIHRDFKGCHGLSSNRTSMGYRENGRLRFHNLYQITSGMLRNYQMIPIYHITL